MPAHITHDVIMTFEGTDEKGAGVKLTWNLQSQHLTADERTIKHQGNPLIEFGEDPDYSAGRTEDMIVRSVGKTVQTLQRTGTVTIVGFELAMENGNARGLLEARPSNPVKVPAITG